MSFARIIALFDFLSVSQIEVVSLNRKDWSLLLSTENYLCVLWDSRYKNWVKKITGGRSASFSWGTVCHVTPLDQLCANKDIRWIMKLNLFTSQGLRRANFTSDAVGILLKEIRSNPRLVC